MKREPSRRYSRLDRFLHRVAFATLGLQKSVADVEDRLYARRIRRASVEAPVFLTALPRAGTTVLLDALASAAAFAVHTYRHMPFLLTPMLWDAFARRYRVEGGVVERAHGDGVEIGFDSAEAFEEVVWRAFWPHKYLLGRIRAWTASDAEPGGDFDVVFKSHIAKMIALEDTNQRERVRYLSKNNANIARIPFLAKLFPEAVVLVAFRNPADHAASMLRQHLNFRELHASEPFVRRYMADIGHYEFGMDRRPLDFGCPERRRDGAGDNGGDGPGGNNVAGSVEALEYWLTYWCDAYEHVLGGSRERVVLVDYDALCENPHLEFRRIAVAAGIADSPRLGLVARRFRPPTRYPGKARDAPAELLKRAAEVHRRLLAGATAARP